MLYFDECLSEVNALIRYQSNAIQLNQLIPVSILNGIDINVSIDTIGIQCCPMGTTDPNSPNQMAWSKTSSGRRLLKRPQFFEQQ